MKEYLDYIKKTGEEISELNNIIHEKDKEIQNNIHRISNLEKELEEKEQTIVNLSELYNEVRYKYPRLKKKYETLEARYDSFVVAFTLIAPKLSEDIKEDIEDEFFSDILGKMRRGDY